MLSRLLILSLLIPACVAPVGAQSSPDRSPLSLWSPQNGLIPPQGFRLHVPALSQNAQANQLQPRFHWDALNLSNTTPVNSTPSSLQNSATAPSRSLRTPHLVTRSGAIVSLAKTQSRTQRGLRAIPRASPQQNFAGKTLWMCLRGRQTAFAAGHSHPCRCSWGDPVEKFTI